LLREEFALREFAMTKKVLAGIILILGGVVAFNWFTTGELTLIPSSPLSAEGRDLSRLHERFVAAAHQYNQAGHAAGVSGMDTTADAQAAIHELDQVEKELLDLKTKHLSPAEMSQVDEILGNIHKLKGN
jgi:hypothetical protein